MIISTFYRKIEWYFWHSRELRENEFLQEVIIDGKTVTNPGEWIKVIDLTYKIHTNLIAEPMRKRYELRMEGQTIAEEHGINRQMFYEWRAEFLTDAISIALARKLFKIEIE